MQNILINVEGGVIQDVIFPDNFPRDIQVIVRDYDIDGSDESILQEDQSGDLFIESIHRY